MEPSENERRPRARSWLFGGLIAIWAVFTISLIGWWYIFSQEQIQKLQLAQGALAEELVRNQKMLMWEGATLLVSLLLGAGALAYFVIRDRKQSQSLMQFFLTFTHELKTPIATVRLYAETLHDSLKKSEHGDLAKQLMKESDRLSLQLENSLTLSQIQDSRLYPEEISLQELLRPLHSEFEKLTISLSKDVTVLGDSQALTTIFRNLFKNATAHGKATSIQITPETRKSQIVSLLVHDNGEGLKGEREMLGKRFHRLYRGSGSGIGLYLSKQLAEKMGGQLYFPESSGSGFRVAVDIPEWRGGAQA